MHCTPQCVRPRMGTKTQHCGVCHQTFSSPSIGDAHRVPESTHDVAGKQVRDSYRNRCLTTDEMTDLGWRAIDGKWSGPKSDVTYWNEGE